MTRRIRLGNIIADPAVQARAAQSEAVAREYADAMRDGATFPPLVVFEDEDGTIRLADGWHRLAAALELEREDIVCDVRPGGLREALLFAVAANAEHGLRRTNADKRRAVVLGRSAGQAGAGAAK